MSKRLIGLGIVVAAALGGGLSLALADDPKPATPAPAKGFPEIKKKELFASVDVRGKQAPKLEVEKWLGKEPDTKGKVVLIDFWATWCPPCRAAIPELEAWQKTFKDDLVVIGISDEQEPPVRKYVEARKIAYPMAIDTKARTKDGLKVQGIPHVLVIDSTGVVRWQGFPMSAEDALDEAVLRQIIEADKAQRPKGEGKAEPKSETSKPAPN